MTETDIEHLIADWYRGLGSPDEEQRLHATAGCPPLTRLWQHVAEGRPLEEHRDHVETCDHCQRVCRIIEQQRHQATEALPSVQRRSVRPVRAAGGLIAVAACIGLAVLCWPRPSFEREIALFADLAYNTDSPVRGEGQEPSAAEATRPPAWITAALNDPAVLEALAVHGATDALIVHELDQGRLRIDPDSRPTIADGVDEIDVQRLDLQGLIERDRAACQAIADALVRYVPGTGLGDVRRIEQALTRYRSRNAFGATGLAH